MEVLDAYRRAGFQGRLGFGRAPALLIVDFSNGFTDPSFPLGGDCDAEVAATARLLEIARARAVPVCYTTVAYEEGSGDGGVFLQKVPSLALLRSGTRWVEIDARIPPRPGEVVIVKKYASAFFGTHLAATLTARGIDTVIICGATTSGCVRATAVDAMQHGFRPIVPRECVADRAPGPHEANLFDIDAKYGDVVPAAEVEEYLTTLRR